MDDDFYIFDDKNAKKIDVYEVYKITSGLENAPMRTARLKIGLFGSWTPDYLNGFNISEILKWERRNDLRELHLKITSLSDVPYVSPFVKDSGGNVEFNGGIYIDIFKVIQAQLNFTYEIVLPSDGSYGILDDNGEWNGMVKMVKDREVDASKIVIIMFDTALL